MLQQAAEPVQLRRPANPVAAAALWGAARRLAQLVLVVWVATTIVFIAIYVVSDPVAQLLPVGTSQDALDALRHQLGLDRPVLVQYFSFLADALHGDFGRSLRLDEPALQVVVERIPVTAVLVVTATVLGSAFGIAMGVIASLRPGAWFDNLLNTVSFGFTSIAPFWLGMMLILLVAVHVDWLATSSFEYDPAHMLLPVITLAVLPAGRIAQVTRSLMIAEARKQYVTTARAKGVSEVGIAFRHQFRNTAPALVTMIFYDFARIFVGDALVVEVVFGISGVGGLASRAFAEGDIYVAQTAVVVAAVIVALSNLAADVALRRMDPRARELVNLKRSS